MHLLLIALVLIVLSPLLVRLAGLMVIWLIVAAVTLALVGAVFG
jgi:hypothetical protein